MIQTWDAALQAVMGGETELECVVLVLAHTDLGVVGHSDSLQSVGNGGELYKAGLVLDAGCLNRIELSKCKETSARLHSRVVRFVKNLWPVGRSLTPEDRNTCDGMNVITWMVKTIDMRKYEQ